MRTAIGIAFGAAALTFSQPASANVWCAGAVSGTYLEPGGGVVIQASWHLSWTQICNLRTEWKGVPPDVCAGWMAKADAAVSMSRQVTVYYSGPSDCAALPTYQDAPSPSYVMLR